MQLYIGSSHTAVNRIKRSKEKNQSDTQSIKKTPVAHAEWMIKRTVHKKKTKFLSSQNQTSFKIYIHTDNNINKEDALVYRTTHVVNIPKNYVYKSKRNEGTEKIVTKNWKLKT